MNLLPFTLRNPFRPRPHTNVEAEIRFLIPKKEFEANAMKAIRQIVKKRQGSDRLIEMGELVISGVYSRHLDDFRELLSQQEANFEARSEAVKLLKGAGVHNIPSLDDLTYDELLWTVDDHVDDTFGESLRKEIKVNNYLSVMIWFAEVFLSWPFAANLTQGLGLRPGGPVYILASFLGALVVGTFITIGVLGIVKLFAHGFNWKTRQRTHLQDQALPENLTAQALLNGGEQSAKHPVTSAIFLAAFVAAMPLIYTQWTYIDARYWMEIAGWDAQLAHSMTRLGMTLLLIGALFKAIFSKAIDNSFRTMTMLKLQIFDAVKEAHAKMHETERDQSYINDTYSLKDWAVTGILLYMYNLIMAPSLSDPKAVDQIVADLFDHVDPSSTRPSGVSGFVAQLRRQLPGCQGGS